MKRKGSLNKMWKVQKYRNVLRTVQFSSVAQSCPSLLDPMNSPAFLMMYSAYKLNKQGDNIQP